MNEFRIGSRQSRLAVAQAELVRGYLRERGILADIVTMKTKGDRILDRTLEQIGGKGLFIKELELALRDGRCDLLVHSLKDMTMDVPEALPIVGYSAREDPRDVLVLPKGADRLNQDKPIGCSSKRRILQAQKIFPEMRFQSIRGNVNTRLDKLDSGEYSALILAAAGLKRLGLSKRISRYFSVDEMIPCAGQGVLALQGRDGGDYSVLQGFTQEEAAVAVICERAFVRAVQGECSSPVAAYASIEDERIVLRGMYGAEEKGCVCGMMEGSAGEPERLACQLADRLLNEFAEIV